MHCCRLRDDHRTPVLEKKHANPKTRFIGSGHDQSATETKRLGFDLKA